MATDWQIPAGEQVDIGGAMPWLDGGGFDITSIVTNLLPDIVKAGVNYAGTAIQNDAMDDAKDRYVDTSLASAARLNKEIGRAHV